MNLGFYRKLSCSLFGPDSEATKFLEQKILVQGENAEVIATPIQMMYVLYQLDNKRKDKPNESTNSE